MLIPCTCGAEGDGSRHVRPRDDGQRAIARRSPRDEIVDELFGAISLDGIAREQGWAEMGYWVGVPYWNNGYCTEAGRLLIKLAFRDLGLHRVQARHLARNPSSGRVMEKLGMRQEGLHRHAVKKWGRFEDVVSYAILAPEWKDVEP